MTNLPHDISPYDFVCTRCLRTDLEIERGQFVCMSDDEIANTKKSVSKMLGFMGKRDA